MTLRFTSVLEDFATAFQGGRFLQDAVKKRRRRKPGGWSYASASFEPLAQTEGAVEDLLEEAAVLADGFQLEVHGVAREHLQGDLAAAAADGAVDLLDAGGVGAVEGVGYAQQGGELADGALLPGLERGELRVARLGRRAPVVAGDVGDDLDLALVEGVEDGVGDQVVGMLVVAAVVDGVADVVEQGGVLQPFAARGCRGRGARR